MKKTFLTITLILIFPALLLAGETSIWKGITNVKLENGLTVLLKEDHAQPLVSVQVWVNAGSVYENPKTYGLSHFLEHLIFKGTDKYPGDLISRKVETQGGSINAATSKEFTEYYIDIQKDAHEDAVKILADAMDNAAFPQNELEKERLVVLEEIYRHEDDPDSFLYDAFGDAIHQKTAYKSRVIGSADVIKNVTRQEIRDYYKAFYVPGNMVLVVMGDFKSDKLLALIKDTFGKQKSGPLQKEPVLTEPAHKPVVIRNTKQVEHTYWMGGFLGPVITETKELLTADILSSILAGGRSSRLNRKIREEKQLVYGIGASYWSMKGNGVFFFTAVMPQKNEKAAVSEIIKEIEILKKNGPDDAELKRVKEMMKAQWFFGNETIHGQAALMAYWYLLGNPEFIDNYVAGIDSISKADVKGFLDKYYGPGLSQAVLTPK